MSHQSVVCATFWFRTFFYLLTLIGVLLTTGGGYLLSLNGSPYYFLCGIAIVGNSFLLRARRAESLTLYVLIVLATLAWSVWEVGWDGWALLPRLAALFSLGVVFHLPGIKRQLNAGTLIPPLTFLIRGAVVAAIIGIGCRAILPQSVSSDPLYQATTTDTTIGVISPISEEIREMRAVALDVQPGDWRHYGNDPGGTRFSSLDQINPNNVRQLKLAWEYSDTADIGYEMTPLKVDRTLFLCAANGVTALNSETGKRIWRSASAGSMSSLCRGVAYHHSANSTERCAERILSTRVVTDPFDVKLIALDANDGRPCAQFGANGEVSLLTGMGNVAPGYYKVTSAPAIVRNKVIVGGAIVDFQYWGGPSGVIRAFDVVTGKLAWAWDMGQPTRTGEPPAGESYTHSTPNSWAPMSVDEALGLVYLPMGNATPDFFGGNRRSFDDQYSSSVVALDVASGKPRWSFQTVHHDVWDYDVASQPSLIDFVTASRTLPALVQPTKRGDIFVLNREDGSPIFPVTELPMPQAGVVPEDRLASTQPFSLKMPSFRGPDLAERDMWGVTPLDHLWCRIQFREARYEGPNTPPGLTASIEMPSYFGGMNWGGIAIDVKRGIGIVNTSHIPLYVRLLPREEVARLQLKRLEAASDHPPVPLSLSLIIDAINPLNRNINLGFLFNPRWRYGGPGEGTPYGSISAAFMSPLQIPCTKPPYGRLSALDLRTGKLLWTQAFGTTRDAGPFGIALRLPLPLGMPSSSGAVVTQSGLTFIGASQEKAFRAYETSSGRLLWEARLPAVSGATPMTYLSPDSQRQFVLIVASGQAIRAYALPRIG